MTATVVNGLKVVSEGPTQAPIFQKGSNKPVFWQQTRTLHLEDGSITYGCQHCDYTHDKAGAIRPHLRVHADPNAPRKPRSSRIKPTGDAQVDALIETLTAAGNKDRLVEHWRGKYQEERGKYQEEREKNRRIHKALSDLGFNLPDGAK